MAISADDELWVISSTTDELGQCTHVDAQWAELTGQATSEALGLGWFSVLHPHDRADAIERLSAALVQKKAFRHEARIRLRNGDYRWALAVGAPRFGEAGAFLGYFGSIVDIHERRVARGLLQERNEQLDVALAAARMGTFVWRIEGGGCEHDARMLELFGRPLDGSLALNDVIDSLLPEDQGRFAGAVARACEPVCDGRLQEDVRVCHPDGTLRWLQISAQVHFAGEPSRPLRMIGAAIDITAREEARETVRISEERLALAHERLTATLRASPTVAFEQDRDLRYVWVQNPALGYRAEELVGRTDLALCEREEDARVLMRIKQRVLDTGTRAREEVRILFEGATRWYDLVVEPRRIGDDIVGVLCAATEITDHKHAEEALRDADRRKDRFLAVLGHELRNPLATIENCVQTLCLEGGLSNAGAAGRTLDMLARQSRHLSRLVDDLLDVSRITLDKIELRREPVDMNLVLSETLEALQPQIDGKGLRIVTYGRSEPAPVSGDPARLSQVLANLLGNAVKYTEAGGVIEIGVKRKDREAVISVSDTGAGIAPELLPHVFDLFMQGGPVHAGGLGIGLALSKQLLELHGGKLEARSEGVGRGSTFVLRLPLALARAPIARERRECTRVMTADKVLVIDDDRDVAASFATLLESFGASVRVVYDGQSGIEEAAAFRPRIAFVDIRMRGIDGYETARRIRARLGNDAPKLVALSGLGQEADRVLGRDAAFDLHLVKPASLQEIERLLAPDGFQD